MRPLLVGAALFLFMLSPLACECGYNVTPSFEEVMWCQSKCASFRATFKVDRRVCSCYQQFNSGERNGSRQYHRHIEFKIPNLQHKKDASLPAEKGGG